MADKTVDALAVLDALRSAADDVVDTNDADNYMELPDERHDELEARYGSKPRSQMASDALLKLCNARWDAVAARAAIAELIEAANVLSDKSLQRTKLTASVYTSHVMRLRAALRACGGAQ